MRILHNSLVLTINMWISLPCQFVHFRSLIFTYLHDRMNICVERTSDVYFEFQTMTWLGNPCGRQFSFALPGTISFQGLQVPSPLFTWNYNYCVESEPTSLCTNILNVFKLGDIIPQLQTWNARNLHSLQWSLVIWPWEDSKEHITM